MKWEKDVCDFCSAGEETPVSVTPVEQTGLGTTLDMCRICYELGFLYLRDAQQAATRIDLSRAVRILLRFKDEP